LHSASSKVPICTLLVPYPTFPPTPSCHVRLCTIHFSSFLSLWSSRACAPRLSVRVNAAALVCTAFVNKLRSSSVSTRSLFQIRLLSVTRRSVLNKASMAERRSLPSTNESFVRNTAVVFCIVDCMSARREEVGVEPFAVRKDGISLMEPRPMSLGDGLCGESGVWLADM
jgi:hypothetical protein